MTQYRLIERRHERTGERDYTLIGCYIVAYLGIVALCCWIVP